MSQMVYWSWPTWFCGSNTKTTTKRTDVMKKVILTIFTLLILCPKSFAATEDNIALLTKKGFFDKPQQSKCLNSYDEIRKVIYNHLKYANSYNLEGLKSLYSPNYVNYDGFGRDIYFDLIKKTWESYPDIRYKADIKNIEINGNHAVAEISEYAEATTNAESGVIKERGLLQSTSGSVYYFEKSNDEWLVTSDHILFEKTSLRYGSAKEMNLVLDAPSQIIAGAQYSPTLKIEAPKDSLVIASIGQENITYPQKTADEVFRKLPDDGALERIFTANTKNINEYAVASFGVTKAEIKSGTEIKIYVTGLGFLMSRVNVIPKNEFVKVEKDEKTK